MSEGVGEKRPAAGEADAGAPPPKVTRATDDVPIQSAVHELQDDDEEEAQLYGAQTRPRGLGSGRARVALCLE